ncbi:glutamyl-tRNA(Gln) amidotransferase subunit B, mitochondrial [Parambassis ranga]|uniref:dCTP pyrophosphatase 1 n=1 Tax=Parambassis ranga TaxID=210632 RepID=A0A6P7J1U6_9TELE|nr:dCTP pyrophosphatase 1 [Parambassis ranga]
MMATNGKEAGGLTDGVLSVSSNGSSVDVANSVVVNGAGTGGAPSHSKVQNGGTVAAQRFTFSPEPTIEDIRRLQAEFTDERNWNQFHQPRNLLMAMVGEVGEVAELFQWRGEVAEGLPDWTESEREHLAHELSDVLIYLVELAEKCRVDLPQAVLRKMALNRLKYPASKVHGSAKKYTEYKD